MVGFRRSPVMETSGSVCDKDQMWCYRWLLLCGIFVFKEDEKDMVCKRLSQRLRA